MSQQTQSQNQGQPQSPLQKKSENAHGKAGVERFENRRTVIPSVDVFEGPDETWLVADLPGVKKEELHIQIENDELRFQAKAAPFDEDEPSFDWVRAFRIPPGVDGTKVTADLREGVLVLKLPKPAELKPRKIEVRGA